jgi:hypothetical protein
MMDRFRKRVITHATLICFSVFGMLWFTASAAVKAEELPRQIADDVFWGMISEFSEPGGYFRSDNFVSNESTFQYVIPELQRNTKPGGVYLGVGPDQNFTYIVALQPRIAFIIDIRRQNMLQHLMYKALIELSADRAEFLSRLFSRKRPEKLDNSNVNAGALFEAYDQVPADRMLFTENLAAIMDRLEKYHGFNLSSEDEKSIQYVYSAFFEGGPDLTYNGPGIRGGRRMPSYGELMVETDGAGQGRSYMASEENFHILRELEKNNLVIPLVGDFAGPKALRSVGSYLKDRGATVTALYTSNVEQYLFQQSDDWRKFYSNVASLPADSSSTFIRAVFNGAGSSFGPGGYSLSASTLLCPIAELIKGFTEGQVTSYADVIQMSR